ncbi:MULTISPECIES: histone deacetylase [Desulfococcus]|uniref:Histone deacetylase domain containing protein n=1 Tax=Desulfococcus multivorans DSM 2059 TaxID=1121405 RepID=S7T9J4_DESML|nr:histone deacetylase [Desulfococcus multivorans]AOY59335.1 histone deacetylase superfamily [Desulfococcus multivorans]AQV01551.1 acetylpolyamine aminohydrolase [Desulfococcus multivorans]EPR33286.1 Histone deacetylase domain containing protein [Desulfococcus multivorans DSM 2059]SKA14292.1 Acetoin utilization deacetylase AcuC [Desulfococcus multivorans DSM 2059]
MKVVFHEDFYTVYTNEPAAAEGRIEAVVAAIRDKAEFVEAVPADEDDIRAVHTGMHVMRIREKGLYDISALAAGGAVQAAEIGLVEPCFALIRPPGHHASADSCWGFCYFNNMAVALTALKRRQKIQTAFVLDIDLHYGDGTVNILDPEDWVRIHNPEERRRHEYLRNVAHVLSNIAVDIIGISAGFDHHREDWGGLLETEDYYEIGFLVRETARRSGGGCFALLEGGYNHDVLGECAAALMAGMSA